MNPKVSCYCSTFARPHLLEESIQSFLNQTYENKEMIIVNDCKEQTLIFDHPQIKIINLQERINPIGKKFNFAANSCSGDIINPWDDDDIFMPWKIETALKYFKNGIFHSNQGFFEESIEEITFFKSYLQCNLFVEKKIFNEVGGYPEEDRSGLDANLLNKLEGKLGNIKTNINKNEIFYLYRWNTVDSLHISDLPPESKNNLEKIYEEKIKNDKNFKTGEIKLNPNWKYDYLKKVKNFTGG